MKDNTRDYLRIEISASEFIDALIKHIARIIWSHYHGRKE